MLKLDNKTWYEMLKEFHAACGTKDPDTPTIPSPEKIELRRSLINEEYIELMGTPQGAIQGAIREGNIGNIAKELCDLIYVAIGAGLAYGIDMDKAFAEVHRSNMTKFKDGKALRRSDGKIIKPDTFEPADMKKVLELN